MTNIQQSALPPKPQISMGCTASITGQLEAYSNNLRTNFSCLPIRNTLPPTAVGMGISAASHALAQCLPLEGVQLLFASALLPHAVWTGLILAGCICCGPCDNSSEGITMLITAAAAGPGIVAAAASQQNDAAIATNMCSGPTAATVGGFAGAASAMYFGDWSMPLSALVGFGTPAATAIATSLLMPCCIFTANNEENNPLLPEASPPASNSMRH